MASLGWNTESTLLPKKAKKIAAPNASMGALKDEVFAASMTAAAAGGKGKYARGTASRRRTDADDLDSAGRKRPRQHRAEATHPPARGRRLGGCRRPHGAGARGADGAAAHGRRQASALREAAAHGAHDRAAHGHEGCTLAQAAEVCTAESLGLRCKLDSEALQRIIGGAGLPSQGHPTEETP